MLTPPIYQFSSSFSRILRHSHGSESSLWDLNNFVVVYIDANTIHLTSEGEVENRPFWNWQNLSETWVSSKFKQLQIKGLKAAFCVILSSTLGGLHVAKGMDELVAENTTLTLTRVASLLFMLYLVLYIVVRWRFLLGVPHPAPPKLWKSLD